MGLETIPQEVLLNEICKRLPLKSVAKFKCVSRHWRTRIPNNYFTKTRLRCPQPNNTLLLCEDRGGIVFPCHNGDVDSICRATPRDLPYDLIMKSRAVGTYHGLICFSDWTTRNAHVWNPLLNQWRTFYFQPRSYNGRGFNFFGFGFDTIKDDYKVVKINTRDSEVYCTIEICHLRNTETRVIVMPSDQVPFKLVNAIPATVNGSIHCIAFHPKNKNLEIVRFDTDREKFVEIPFSSEMPNINYDVNVKGIEGLNLGRLALEGFEMDGKQFQLGVYKGSSLCLFISDSSKVEVWLMESYCKNREFVWTRMLEIQLGHKLEAVVGFSANDEVIVRYAGCIYYAYDPLKGHIVFPLGAYQFAYQTMPYVESLVHVLPPRNLN